jgi:hypothetical protein
MKRPVLYYTAFNAINNNTFAFKLATGNNPGEQCTKNNQKKYDNVGMRNFF